MPENQHLFDLSLHDREAMLHVLLVHFNQSPTGWCSQDHRIEKVKENLAAAAAKAKADADADAKAKAKA
jgi:hypothetical protein